jgi:hypothetical protein
VALGDSQAGMRQCQADVWDRRMDVGDRQTEVALGNREAGHRAANLGALLPTDSEHRALLPLMFASGYGVRLHLWKQWTWKRPQAWFDVFPIAAHHHHHYHRPDSDAHPTYHLELAVVIRVEVHGMVHQEGEEVPFYRTEVDWIDGVLVCDLGIVLLAFAQADAVAVAVQLQKQHKELS